MKYLIALLLITNICFSQEWSETKLNDFSSIEFPFSPDKAESNGEVYFSTSDDLGAYIVTVKDFNSDPIKTLSEFYEGVVSGTLEAVNGELLEKKEFEYNNLKGLEIIFLANSNPQLPDLRYKRLLYISNHLISYEFLTFKENEQLVSTNKEKFFNSFSAIIKDGNEPEVKRNNDYGKGLIIGKIFGFLFVIGIIIGGIMLIRNLTKKKE
ncbi:hypothetical protein [Winogradskyella sp. Asnod2-B02-A]|uniref:hypothetical protein n=1 Tax=Winogradskyella sp. Asnod2-B02-A TaxID=3160583 RepID=UPI00386B834D